MGQQGELVPDDAYVLRLIHPSHFNPDAPIGERVASAGLKSEEFKHPNRPSIWIESSASFEQIVQAAPGFAKYGIARFQASHLAQFDIRIEYSPDECTIPELKEAHASLVGVRKANRDEIVEALDRCVIRLPARL